MEIPHRPRRNRKNAAIREAIKETQLNTENLIHPLFLLDDKEHKEPTAILSMPNWYRLPVKNAEKEIEECTRLGLKNFILFPVIPENKKDKTASYSYAKDCFYLEAISRFKNKFADVNIITDVAMDPYSSDGHDGFVKDGEILNDETLEILVKMSLAQAKAGADILGPSDMMDGRIGALRQALDRENFSHVSLMSYTAKFASAFYGPFRDALDSAPKFGDKKTYQMDFRNRKEALLEADLDANEGADFLMVKPALAYLDIISDLKQNFLLPIVAYNVSGEYSMVKAAAAKGWLDNDKMMIETLTAIKRAGADLIITYFAKEYAQLKHGQLRTT